MPVVQVFIAQAAMKFIACNMLFLGTLLPLPQYKLNEYLCFKIAV